MPKKTSAPPASKKRQLQASVDPEIFDAVTEEARDNFTSPSDVVNIRLGALYRAEHPEAFPITPAKLQSDRKSEMENELLALKLAKERGDFVPRSVVRDKVGKRFAVVASRVKVIPQSLIGATPEQVSDLKKIVQDCLTDLSRGDPDGMWDDLDGLD